MELVKNSSMRRAYKLFRVFFIMLKYSARRYLSLKQILFSHKESSILYFTSCNLCHFYNSTNLDSGFFFTPRASSISFSEALFGSKPIDTVYVRSGLIATRYVIRRRPIIVALNYGGCLKCSISRRAVGHTDRSLRLISRAFA